MRACQLLQRDRDRHGEGGAGQDHARERQGEPAADGILWNDRTADGVPTRLPEDLQHALQGQVSSVQVVASEAKSNLTEIKVEEIKRLNHLDVELYEFAREVMLQRFESMKDEDQEF